MKPTWGMIIYRPSTPSPEIMAQFVYLRMVRPWYLRLLKRLGLHRGFYVEDNL